MQRFAIAMFIAMTLASSVIAQTTQPIVDKLNEAERAALGNDRNRVELLFKEVMRDIHAVPDPVQKLNCLLKAFGLLDRWTNNLGVKLKVGEEILALAENEFANDAEHRGLARQVSAGILAKVMTKESGQKAIATLKLAIADFAEANLPARGAKRDLFQLYIAYDHVDDAEKLLADLERQLAVDPARDNAKRAMMASDRAALCGVQHRYDEAAEFAAEAMRLTDQTVAGRRNFSSYAGIRVFMLLSANRNEEAVQVAKEGEAAIVEIDGGLSTVSRESRRTVAVALRRAGRLDEANRQITALIDDLTRNQIYDWPILGMSYNLRGIILTTTNHPREAMADFERSLQAYAAVRPILVQSTIEAAKGLLGVAEQLGETKKAEEARRILARFHATTQPTTQP